VSIKAETIVGAFILLAAGLLVYMSFQLGSMRLDLARYRPYSILFTHVSNLLPKADIKIAGVKVGWVEGVELQPDTMQVKVSIKVLKEFPLYHDASAFIRQDGLLGVKYLELIPGHRDSGYLSSGGRLPLQEQSATSLDDILEGLHALVKQVKELGNSLGDTLSEARTFITGLQEKLPVVDKVAENIDDMSKQFQKTAQVLSQTGSHINTLFEGEEGPLAKAMSPGGSLNKLLSDDQLYRDIKSTSDYARSCVEEVRTYGVGLDSHLEILPRSHDAHSHTQVKWYGDGYIGSSTGLFGKVGFVYASQGFAKREINPTSDHAFVHGNRNGFRLNLQFGKYWHPYVALRFGIIEGTAGVGLDWWFAYSRFKWLSTLELFDFRGYNRFDHDRRPQLKWLNRVFFTNNLYLSFGADDILSTSQRSGFIGIGTFFSLPSLFEETASC